MIASQDRSGWFGASDTAYIMGNWNTVSFTRWWLQKLGVLQIHISTPAMRAGSAYEHRILHAIGIVKMDRQIKRRFLRLRVNLDGEDKTTVHEVKTYSADKFTVTNGYWMQCQVEMYASKKKCVINAYRLLPEDYENFFNPIDAARLSEHPIAYDADWINSEYLPRLRYLRCCMRRKERPHEFTR